MAVMAAIAMRRNNEAAVFADALVSVLEQGFNGAYDASTGLINTNSDQYVGNASWALMALVHFAKHIDDRYADIADSLADWIKRFYVSGAFKGGVRGNGSPIETIITEAQVDAIAALRGHSRHYGGNHGSIVADAESYLFETLFYAEESRFYAGITNGVADTTHYLDNILWAGLMTEFNLPAIAQCLPSVEELAVSVQPDINPILTVTGYSDMVGKQRIFTEGHAYMSLLCDKLGRPYSLESMEKLTVEDQGFVIHSNDPAWVGGSTLINSEATLWYVLASTNFNPFDI
ncbi:hypothetical protein [Streptomyces cinereoruber]|uniref:hypothetical protein n=1 Tax=Streptomyces cinereoruber TaxID=67260 RepID=UPI00363A7415